MSLDKICKQCDKIFQVRAPNELAYRVHCSKKCQVEATLVTKIEVVCKVCGKQSLLVPSIAKNAKFCSRRCKGIDRHRSKDPSLRYCPKCTSLKLHEMFSPSTTYCKLCTRVKTSLRHRTLGGKFCFSRSLAKKRDYCWEITIEQYAILMKNPCHYCGYALDETGVGLDRKDNAQGYKPDNVVPCCGSCNTTRSDNYSYAEMLILAETIKTIKAKRIS